MAITKLSRIENSDTLAEGKDKINQVIERIDSNETGTGLFNDLIIYNDVEIQGTLTVSQILEQGISELDLGSLIVSLGSSDAVNVGALSKGIGISWNYVKESEPSVSLTGFFGSQGGESTREEFTFIPEATVSNGVVTGSKGKINAYIEASDILNAENLSPSFGSQFLLVGSENQSFAGIKTASGLLKSTNDEQGSETNEFLLAGRKLVEGNGVSISNGGVLTSDVEISIDSGDFFQKTNNFKQVVENDVDFDGDVIFTSDSSVTFKGNVSFLTVEYIDTLTNQEIFSEKVFRNQDGADGILIKPRSGGNSDYKVSITTEELTGDRELILSNSDMVISSGTTMSLEIDQTVTSSKTFSKNINFSDPDLNKIGITGTVGGNDYWFVGSSSTSQDAAYLEIATGDDGTEPIYISQYRGNPAATDASLEKQLTLLDSSGNTSVPGIISMGSPGTSSNHVVRADRQIIAGTGLSGTSNLTNDVTLSVDASVIRTTGDYDLTGNYTFENDITGTIQYAKQLASDVLINGVPFDGSSNITIQAELASVGAIVETSQVISQDYEITSGRNGLSAGPISILQGITITIPEGSTWTIV